MKSTVRFKSVIKRYLDDRANSDELFAETYAKPNKNIDDCITYILNEVQRSGCNGFADDEIYSMAVHYYDEDSVTAGKPINSCRIVVNHVVELTAEEKEEARKEAMKRATNEAYNKMKQPKKNGNKPAVSNANATNLFNF